MNGMDTGCGTDLAIRTLYFLMKLVFVLYFPKKKL